MRKINTRSIINFDNSATTYPKPPAIAKAVAQAVERYGGNPGRSGHKLSMRVSEKIFSVRQQAAEMFGAQTENVAFTANCTHALNMAIKGVMQYGGHMIISDHEHNAVARPVYALSKTRDVKYSIARTGETDSETVENFRRLITPETKCICCTVASNVTGRLMPYRELAVLCKAHGICFIADGAQACGLLELSLSDGFNFLCTAGHKGLYGPMGTGLLIINSETTPDSLIQGGTGSDSANLNQPEILPDKYESGTPNLPGIAGLNAGIKFVLNKKTDRIYNSELSLARMLYKRLEKAENVILYTKMPEKSHSVPVISFNIKNTESETVAKILNDSYNIAVRAGLHCAPLAHKSFGTQDTGTVRAVVSAFTTKNDVVYFANAVSRISKNNKQKKTI